MVRNEFSFVVTKQATSRWCAKSWLIVVAVERVSASRGSRPLLRCYDSCMSETPEDLKREAEEDKIRSYGLKCRLCKEDITTPADLESYRGRGEHCSRCAHKSS